MSVLVEVVYSAGNYQFVDVIFHSGTPVDGTIPDFCSGINLLTYFLKSLGLLLVGRRPQESYAQVGVFSILLLYNLFTPDKTIHSICTLHVCVRVTYHVLRLNFSITSVPR